MDYAVNIQSEEIVFKDLMSTYNPDVSILQKQVVACKILHLSQSIPRTFAARSSLTKQE